MVESDLPSSDSIPGWLLDPVTSTLEPDRLLDDLVARMELSARFGPVVRAEPVLVGFTQGVAVSNGFG